MAPSETALKRDRTQKNRAEARRQRPRRAGGHGPAGCAEGGALAPSGAPDPATRPGTARPQAPAGAPARPAGPREPPPPRRSGRRPPGDLRRSTAAGRRKVPEPPAPAPGAEGPTKEGPASPTRIGRRSSDLRAGYAGRERRSANRSSPAIAAADRKSTRLNSSHVEISYAVFCLKKKKKTK